MRGATLVSGVRLVDISISIHAPHAGCDPAATAPKNKDLHFNPRTPCGVRLACCMLFTRQSEFQSTHPMRGATGRRYRIRRRLGISIHAPHAGCDELYRMNDSTYRISIHAPHAGCDARTRFSTNSSAEFQSTHPMRGATEKAIAACTDVYISIHAPHAGCDIMQSNSF